MKLKNLVVSLLVLFIFANVDAYASLKQYDDFSVYFNLTRADRITPIKDSTVQFEKIKNFYGAGVSYNNFRADYTTYFEGHKVSFNYDFARDSVASPYIGAMYIFGIADRYTKTTKEYLAGSDIQIGGSVNLLNIVKPYVEYRLRNSMFGFGVRIHLNKRIKRGKLNVN